MDEITAKALEESIAHWKRMKRFKRVGQFQAEDVGVADCALCRLFWDDGCVKCPVMEKSGFLLCMGTPFRHASELSSLLENASPPRNWKPWRKAAQIEIDFLEGLRD